MSVTLDLMEYANDAAAQAAYVTDAVEIVDQEQTGYSYTALNFGGAGPIFQAMSFKITAPWITAVELREGDAPLGPPTGNWTLRIETDNEGVPSGTLANANASIVVTPPGANTIIKGTFATPFSLTIGTLYWLVVQVDAQPSGHFWYLSLDFDVYPDGNQAQSVDGGLNWVNFEGNNLYFKIYAKALQSFSENTIFQQGSYSLKGVAAQTGSLNETLTRTI